MRKITFLNSKCVVKVEKMEFQLKPNQVLVKTFYAGVNRIDILQKSGILGVECSGIVEKIGKNVKAIKVGDRVCCLTSETYSDLVVCDEGVCVKVPKKMKLSFASGILETFLTAYQGIFFVAKIQKEKNLPKCALVHAGGSGVGQALIQILKSLSIKVITTSSKSKFQRIKELGGDLILNRYENWSEKIKEYLQKNELNGVGLIFDCVGKDYFQENLSVLSVDGKWVFYGLLSGSLVENVDLRKILFKRISMYFTLLKARSIEYKRELVKEFLKFSNNLLMFESGELILNIDSIYDVKNVNEAHKKMKNNENKGKIILEFCKEEEGV